MNVFDWIEQELHPVECDSAAFMYDDMESQSNHCLPIIYQPFDAHSKAHWRDRGFCYDYLYATKGDCKNLLDFGPGDGWPSLIVAPFANEVIGVDASKQRVRVCTENARRLDINNTTFQHVASGNPLPFENDAFDGIMAASSIEQTPDPKFTLSELHRVLKPGGRLRMHYENLGYYAGGKEQELFLDEVSESLTELTLYDRHIDEEYATMHKLFFTMRKEELMQYLQVDENNLLRSMFAMETFEKIGSRISDSRVCRLHHPSGMTYLAWLQEIGFSAVLPTHNGADAAGKLYHDIPAHERPRTMADIDALIRPAVKRAIQIEAPCGIPNAWDPMITAVK
jgi:SAM-dependent methyltransferase